MQTNPTYELPPELCTKPLALVGVSGLDTVNNAIHKLIWEAFNSVKRTEKTCVSYKLIQNDHEFPVIKPKRNSYDWYVPKGILKRNWMKKYLYEVPAVIAIFYDLDWNDSSWSEKMIECASRVQSMRAALEGRNTRIALVLIQNVLPPPTGEDVQATERAVSICASCELQSNSLFVLPQGDHLHGYILRLETAFFEFAQNYYHNEIRTIKSHKEHLNKNNHQALFVRHQFKLGFLYELKQDIQTAHKHYTHAYNSLLEIRIVDTNALEIRTVAGFINYKLCKQLFALNLPRDAIAHFRAHIDKFKQRIGFQELAFEHYAWLSKQYAVFGDVFDSAVKIGITPVQTQHPGIYYQQAAEYAIQRKKVAQEICQKVTAYPDPDPFESMQHPDFFGQRHWKMGKTTIEPLDPDVESRGIQALQYLEKQVNHSNIIISLYGLAIKQHKIYKCPRTRRFLALQMADEYYTSGDFGKCLTLLTHMLYDLRNEKWWKLLSDILIKAFKCAYLTANVTDYLSIAFELLGKDTILNFEEKKLIYENIERVLKVQIPYSDTTLQPDVLQNTIVQWQSAYSKLPLKVTLDLGNITSCIEARAKFMKSSYPMNEPVTIKLFIRNVSPFVLTFKKLSVLLSDSTMTFEIVVTEKSLDFKPGDLRKFSVEFLSKPEHVDKILQITCIAFSFGEPSLCDVNLKLMNTTNVYDTEVSPELKHFQLNNDEIDCDIVALSKTQILPRISQLKMVIEHPNPALEGEWYEITVRITSEETDPLKNFKLEINLLQSEFLMENAEFRRKLEEPSQKLPMMVFEQSLLEEREFVIKFYMRVNKLKQQNRQGVYQEYELELTASYDVSIEPKLICIKRETTVVNPIKPFEINLQFLSSIMENIYRFYCGEVFHFAPTIQCLSPWPIEFQDAKLELNYQVESAVENETTKIKDLVMENSEMCTDFYSLICHQTSEQNINIGTYSFTWRRENGISATKEIPVSGFPVEWVPFHLSVTSAAHGIVRKPLLITYNIENISTQLLQLNLNMETSDGFMFAGYKQTQISVLPKSTNSVQFNLYPLITGKVILPKIVLKLPEPIDNFTQEDLNRLLERSLPGVIFIMPQTKGTPPAFPVECSDVKMFKREEVRCYIDGDGDNEGDMGSIKVEVIEMSA